MAPLYPPSFRSLLSSLSRSLPSLLLPCLSAAHFPCLPTCMPASHALRLYLPAHLIVLSSSFLFPSTQNTSDSLHPPPANHLPRHKNNPPFHSNALPPTIPTVRNSTTSHSYNNFEKDVSLLSHLMCCGLPPAPGAAQGSRHPPASVMVCVCVCA